MHREFREGKRVIAIVTSLITITIALYIYQFATIMVGNNSSTIIILEIILCIFTLIILKREMRKCKVVYKYCIISDKLIINKIENKCEENVESLKIKDILYIGECCKVPKEFNKGRCCRHYIRSFDKNKKFCCVYQKNGQISKFIFEPSNVLVDRIGNIK